MIGSLHFFDSLSIKPRKITSEMYIDNLKSKGGKAKTYKMPAIITEIISLVFTRIFLNLTVSFYDYLDSLDFL